MKELNLEAGQKCWSIQLGECEVIEPTNSMYYPYRCQSIKDGAVCSYTVYGKDEESDAYPSLFESNPFIATTQLPQGEISISKIEPESKIDLINALCFVIATNETLLESKNIANRKLQKLLESL